MRKAISDLKGLEERLLKSGGGFAPFDGGGGPFNRTISKTSRFGFGFRARTIQAMDTVREQFVIDAKGKKTGVILPLKRYQKLMEDLHDLLVVAERRSEEPISLEDMKRRLRKDGVI